MLLSFANFLSIKQYFYTGVKFYGEHLGPINSCITNFTFSDIYERRLSEKRCSPLAINKKIQYRARRVRWTQRLKMYLVDQQLMSAISFLLKVCTQVLTKTPQLFFLGRKFICLCQRLPAGSLSLTVNQYSKFGIRIFTETRITYSKKQNIRASC